MSETDLPGSGHDPASSPASSRAASMAPEDGPQSSAANASGAPRAAVQRAQAIGGFAAVGAGPRSAQSRPEHPAVADSEQTSGVGQAPDDHADDSPWESAPSTEALGSPGMRRQRVRTLLVGDYPQLRSVVSNWYLILTLIVRLPSVILPLTVLTCVTLGSGDELWGAACAAAVHLGQSVSVLALIRGDRIRRRQWIMLLHTVAHVAVICLLVFRLAEQSSTDPTGAWPWHLCLLAGLSAPQLGNATRLRWRPILERHRSIDLILPSMRHDAVMDAVSLVLGALVVGILAVTLGPLLGIVAAAGLLVVCTTALLLHPTADILADEPRRSLAEARPTPHNQAMRRRLRTQRRMRFLPVLGGGCIGVMLGSIQMCLVYFTASVEAIETIGAQFAALGLMAGLAAVLAAGTRPLRPWNMWILFGALTVIATLMMSLPTRPVWMVLTLAIMGAAIGPTLVAVFSTVPLITPLSEVTGLTAGTTILIQLGMGLGVGLAGVIGDQAGYETAVLLPVLAAAALLATAFVLMDRRSRVPLDFSGERPIPGTEPQQQAVA